MTQSEGQVLTTFDLPIVGAATVPWRYLAATEHRIAWLDADGTEIGPGDYGTDFTIAPTGDTQANVGTLTLEVAPPADAVALRLYRDTTLSQAFSGSTSATRGVERQLDRHTLAQQEARHQLMRTVRTTEPIPPVAPGADGTVLMWQDAALVPGPTADQIALANELIGGLAPEAMIFTSVAALKDYLLLNAAIPGRSYIAGGRAFVGRAGALAETGLPGLADLDGARGARDWAQMKAPEIIGRSRPRYLTPEMYVGLETQIVYAEEQDNDADYSGSTDFSDAFDALRAELQAMKSAHQWPALSTYPAGIGLQPGLRYLHSRPVPLYDLYSTGLMFNGNGGVLVAGASMNCQVDMVGSRLLTLRDLRIEADSDLTIPFGVLMGRPKITPTIISAERNRLSNVAIHGWYSQAGLYNFASEVMHADQLTIYQYFNGAPALMLDCTNVKDIGLYSEADVTVAAGDDASMNDGFFSQLDARCVQGCATGVVHIRSSYLPTDNIIRNWTFLNAYLVNTAGVGNTDPRPGFYLSGQMDTLVLDAHCEPYQGTDRIRISHNIYCDTARNPMTLRSLKTKDHMSDAQLSFIDCNSTANALELINAEIDVPMMRGLNTLAVQAKLFGPNMTAAEVHGIIKAGAGAHLNDLSGLGQFNGLMMTEAQALGVTLPTTGAVHIIAAADPSGTSHSLSIQDVSTPDNLTIDVAGYDVVRITGGTIATVAGFTDGSRRRRFYLVNGRGVSITVNGLVGASVTLAAGAVLELIQVGTAFYAAN
jgi:hypothetical protein